MSGVPSVTICGRCGGVVRYVPHTCDTITYVADAPDVPAPSSRLALLEAVAKAARAWVTTGKWDDYKRLTAALIALEAAS